MGKELWTDGNEGESISVYSAYNELDEARFAVGKIKAWQDEGGALASLAAETGRKVQVRRSRTALHPGRK